MEGLLHLLTGLLPSGTYDYKFRDPVPTEQRTINLSSPPQPSQPSTNSVTPEQILAGLTRFGHGTPPPIASQSAALAQAGQGLPHPLLPAVLALMETGGLAKPSSPNNVYNIGPGVAYPSPEVAILGGGPNSQRGFSGVLHSGLYDKYLHSGDLTDFFNVFTPPGAIHNNPTMDQLLQRANSLEQLFH